MRRSKTWRGPFESDLSLSDTELGFEGMVFQVKLIDRVAEALDHPRKQIELLDPICFRAVVVSLDGFILRAPVALLTRWVRLSPPAMISRLSVVRFTIEAGAELHPKIADRIRLRVSGLRRYDKSNPVISRFAARVGRRT